MGYSLFTEPNFFDDSHDPHNVRRKAPFAFDVGERYANFVDQNTAVDGGSGRPKRFIHFGHHGVRPQVSQRVANESAMVAKLANDIFNSGLAPEMTCPKTPLLECIDSSEMILEKMSSSFMLSHCLQKICPNRAQELAPLFANDRSHRYRALKDIPLFFMNNPSKAKIVLRKGSIVSGRLEPRLGKYDLITPDVLEVEIEDGTKIYAPGHSFFGFAITSLDGNFEEIN
jgi:hypothetical protein